MHDAEASQAVIARALLTIIDQNLVLVLCLEEATHSPSHQTILLDEFVAVVALFQEDGSMILLMGFVVLHLAVRIEGLPCPPTAHIHIAAWQSWGVEEEVYDHIFGRSPVIVIVRTPDHIDTILVLEISVGMVDLSRSGLSPASPALLSSGSSPSQCSS